MSPGATRRFVYGALGLVLILIGVPLLVLPGPGLLLIGAGGWFLLRAAGKNQPPGNAERGQSAHDRHTLKTPAGRE